MTAYSSFIFKYKTINYGASRAGYDFKLIKVSMTDVSGTGLLAKKLPANEWTTQIN